MDLILHFDRKSLGTIKKHIKLLTDDNLNFIELTDFCAAIMNRIISKSKIPLSEADKTSQPFTVDSKKTDNERSAKTGTLQESAEVLRMKKLAGIIK